jgi:hypothetical protein
MRAHRAPDGVIELCDDSCDHGRPWEAATATFNPHREWLADDWQVAVDMRGLRITVGPGRGLHLPIGAAIGRPVVQSGEQLQLLGSGGLSA